MTVLRRLLERRDSLENPKLPLTSTTLANLLGGMRGKAGVHVSEESAARMTAVYRCMALIAGTNAALPLKVYATGTRKARPSILLAQPHPARTRFEHWELVGVHLLGWGNSYQLKTRNGLGRIVQLSPIHPSRVRVDAVDESDDNPAGKVFAITSRKGNLRPYTSREIMHIPGLGFDGIRGLSPIGLAREGIGLALAAEEFGARLFGSGALQSGFLQTDAVLDEEKADALKKRWMKKMAGLEHAHEVAVLDSGAKFQSATINPADTQFIQSRRFQVEEIARLFGVPPHLLMATDKTTSWGSGVEQQNIAFVQHTLRSWLTRIEQRVTLELLPVGEYAEFAVEGLLRGDMKSRYEAHRIAVGGKPFRTVNEVRADENEMPVDGGDSLEPIPAKASKVPADG